MAKLNELLVWFPTIEPSAARVTVVASCDAPAEGLRLRGWLEGPTCAYAKTVEGEAPLVSEPVAEGIKADGAVQAGAVVLEPCLWEPEHPFLYHAEVGLWHDDEKLDERILSVGIRHLECDEKGFRLNGRRLQLTGAKVAGGGRLDEESLGSWHGVGCVAVGAESVSEEMLHRADRLGVFLIVHLPDGTSGDGEALLSQLSQWRLHPSVALWTVEGEGQVEAVRRLDPSRPIAMRGKPADLPGATDADLLAVTGSPDELAELAARSSKPLLAWCEDAMLTGPDAFADALAERREQLANVPSLAGIVI